MLNVSQVLPSKTALPKIFGKSKLWASQPYESLCVCQNLKISVIPISLSQLGVPILSHDIGNL